MVLSTSLNLGALLKSAGARLGLGTPAGRISGLTASAKALCVAASSRAGACSVIVVPTDADVEQMTSDVRFFLSALEGLSESDAERWVLPFPSHEVDPYRGLLPHLDIASARARALHALVTGEARVVIASAVALLPRVSSAGRLREASLELKPSLEIPPEELGRLLVDAGFTREDPVDQHGEFSIRGGIVDLFPPASSEPIRLEFIGDVIESIRHYDPVTQRSTRSTDQGQVLPLIEVLDGQRESQLFEYASTTGIPAYFVSEAEGVAEQAQKFLGQMQVSYREALQRKTPGVRLLPPQHLFIDWDTATAALRGATLLDELTVETGDLDRTTRHIACQPAVSFRGRFGDWVADVRDARGRGETVLFVAATPGRGERIAEMLADREVLAAAVDRAEGPPSTAVLIAIGKLSRGFRLPEAGLQIVAERDVFEEEGQPRDRPKSVAGSFLSDFRDLKVGDFVVHVDHGIGEFVGLRQIRLSPADDAEQDFIELRYSGADKLYVPVERLDLLQKYTGGSRPALDRLGGATWERAKTRVRRAMRDMASELLKLYAARRAAPGFAFSPDSHWHREFDDAFEWELTPDQHAAIAEIKRDMEAPTPMDRLLCGDVGYGKTEVAMRAAFKAVMDGKQVAVLAPTTVLAFQHLKTFSARFAAFPVRIEMVSRFRSKAEQRAVLADLEGGRVEIIIGTHRLLSKDVQFRDLGLLIVDEEQRFGVAHKERIKQLRRRVDVLTMTATPIPRTLNMSLVGIRDMSIIETPPKDRLAIQTNVVKFDPQVIARAIRNEIERGGQIYVVHNRVESIASMASLVTRLVPEARVAVAHGQMGERELERVMVDFVAHQSQVLLATTIIENGLDIPNANTLIVNRSDRYGLAQLYQLRGRVGRSDRRAYAYLLIPPEDNLSMIAKKRLAAIREFSDLGSGFRVAALDLEIRGAGNLLGGEQSGHIAAIGFDLYMKLLEQTVRELKGEEMEDDRRAAVNLKVDLRIQDDYIPDMNQRLSIYRRVAAARSEAEVKRVIDEVRDRYGPVPDSVMNLADYGRIRVMADRLGIETLDREGQTVVIRFRTDAPIEPIRLLQLVTARDDLKVLPPGMLKLTLKAARAEKQSRAGWWTERATVREVKPGFTKSEILKPPPEDPRAEDGVFSQVAGLLSTLGEEGWRD